MKEKFAYFWQYVYNDREFCDWHLIARVIEEICVKTNKTVTEEKAG